MAHHHHHPLYELGGLDGQSMSLQSFALLDNTSSYTTLVAADPSICPGSFVIEDEGDVFQCGRCKKQFDSLTYFMRHKREGCSSILASAAVSVTSSKEFLKSFDSHDGHHHQSHQEFHGSTGNNNGVDDGEGDAAGGTVDESCADGDGDSSYIEDDAGDSERSLNATTSILHPSSIGIHQHNESHHHHRGTEECSSSFVAGSTPVIHISPSMVLGEETLSFTIPIDHHSGLVQLLSGANSSSVLSIPESELAALINAGERFHMSSSSGDPSTSINHIYLTTSIMPSNIKDSSLIQLTKQGPVVTDSCEDPMRDLEVSDLQGHEENSSSTHSLTAKSLIGGTGTVLRIRETNVLRSQNEIGIHFDPLNTAAKETTRVGGDPMHAASYSEPVKKPTVKRSEIAKEIGNSDGSKLSQGNTEVKRKCEYCGKPFKKLFNLHQHIRSHTGEKPFHCLVCGRGFTQKSNVKKHMQTHKVWPKVKYTLPKEQISVKVKQGTDADDAAGIEREAAESLEYVVNNVYVCQYCDQHFENYHKLKTHLSHTHKNEKLFKCIHKDCLATFLEVEGLICHMKTHEDQLEYQCQSCPKKFKNINDLGAHQYSHRLQPPKVIANQSKQFRCTKCNSKYASAEALNHHLLTSSHNYPCSQCKLTFVCERYLRRHLRIHGTVEPFRCELCGKMFKTENYLKSHLVIHSDSKPFHCEICKQSFNRRDKLTRHKLMHDNRKKYKCPYKNVGCEREFYRKDKLKDHMMSHTRKNYSCSKCGKNFTWPTRLRQHQVDQHPEMMASTTCPTCNKIFKTKHHLKLHICRAVVSDSKTVPDCSTTTRKDDFTNEGTSGSSIFDGGGPTTKLILYNDCEIENTMTDSGGERQEDAMLFPHAHDHPEIVILPRFSDCDERGEEQDHDINHDEVMMGPVEMSFDTSAVTPIDEFITAD